MLAEWQARLTAHTWSDAYVFFKHDYIDGAGPLAVERFVRMVNAPTVRAGATSVGGMASFVRQPVTSRSAE